MAKSLQGPGGSVPEAALLPGLGALAAGPKTPSLGVPGLSPRAPKSAPQSPAAAREAQRCAVDGVRLVQRGRVAAGIALLRRSVQLHPGAAAAHHDLGVALMTAGRLEEAAEAFAAALRLSPSYTSAHHALAQIFDALGQEAKAMESYQAAVRLKPDLVAAQLRLGEIYLARGLHAEFGSGFSHGGHIGPANGRRPNRGCARPGGRGGVRRGARRHARRRRGASRKRAGPGDPGEAAGPCRPLGGGGGAPSTCDRACSGHGHRLGRHCAKQEVLRPRTARLSRG